MVAYVYLYIGYVKYIYNIFVFYSYIFFLYIRYSQCIFLLFAVHLKHPALLKDKLIINGHILLQVYVSAISAVSSYP